MVSEFPEALTLLDGVVEGSNHPVPLMKIIFQTFMIFQSPVFKFFPGCAAEAQ